MRSLLNNFLIFLWGQLPLFHTKICYTVICYIVANVMSTSNMLCMSTSYVNSTFSNVNSSYNVKNFCISTSATAVACYSAEKLLKYLQAKVLVCQVKVFDLFSRPEVLRRIPLSKNVTFLLLRN